MTKERQRTRIRGLDGLRTLAVLLVLGYHLLVGVFNSGFIGVDVFFVISGFLITSLLMREKETSEKIDIRAFWVRRIRRLVPAVVVATLSVVWLARVVGGDSAVQLRWQSLGAVTGTYNWLEVAYHSSYFERQSPMLLTNMWSLAVEQQFYLVWPLVLVLILGFVSWRFRPHIALGLAALSFGANVVMTYTGKDITRAYVGTDTHSFGLMIGAALALSLPRLLSGKRKPLSDTQVRRYGIYGWLGLLVIIALAAFVPDDPRFYPWVMLGASVASAALIRAMLPDMRPLLSVATLWEIFDSRPMRWIGERSYGIYLWHWPLWVIAYYSLRLSVIEIAIYVTLLSVLLAHLSYVFIETPIRRMGFLAFVRRIIASVRSPRRLLVTSMVTVLLVGVLIWAFISSPNKTSAEQFIEEGQHATVSGTASADPSQGSSQGPSQKPSQGASQKPEPSASATEIPMPTGEQISLIGDSVSLGSSAALQERLPGIAIDAVVSRNITHVPGIIDTMLAQGTLREYVIISVSANSAISQADIDSLLEKIGPERKLVLVTGYGPERCTWIPPTNAAIREAADANEKQIRVVDWETIAASNQHLLAGDRVHPNTEGTGLFADEIVRALDSF
ncbi:MAG: acyltransferase [Actinomycetaceae bacterium]|nr:acyltransferase [Actinomycetaceae bacterium]